MNKKSKIIVILLIVFLCIITTPFIYSKYAHTIRKTINLNISKPTYTVVFHSNNGSDNTRTQIFSYGTSQALYANTFSKSGEYFAGWNTEANGTGSSYTDKQVVNNLTSINNGTIDLYAQWVQGIAYTNGAYYPSLKAAVEAVPADGNSYLVRLLADTSEAINVASGINIEFDFQNYTITNSGTKPIIENYGTIKISNGYLTSSTTQGAINVQSGGKLIMDGGSVEATGTRQALYINGGTAEISGTAYLSSVSDERAAVQCLKTGTLTITGGTIVSQNYWGVKTENTCQLTVGVKDGTSHHDDPLIQGIQYGIYNVSTKKINFYDGIAKGTAKGIYAEDKVDDIETGYIKKQSSEMIDGVQYGNYYLFRAITVTLDPNGGTVRTSTLSVEEGDEIGIMPVPSRSGYIFEGWYTSNDELVTEDRIINNEEIFHAEWIKRSDIYVAEYNGVQYHSLQAAINATPSDGTASLITLLMDSREHVTVNENHNIILDSQGYSLKNDGNKTIFENYGTLTINDGEISSNENYAVIDNFSTGRIYITGGSVFGSGTRQAIYNDSGYVEISGMAYLSSCASGKPTNSQLERATIQNLENSTLVIKGGTIIGENNQAISNEGSLSIGLKDGFINANSPAIRGKTYAVKSLGIFNFYDGILKGMDTPYNGTIDDMETNSSIVTATETIDYSQYNTAYLDNSQ